MKPTKKDRILLNCADARKELAESRESVRLLRAEVAALKERVAFEKSAYDGQLVAYLGAKTEARQADERRVRTESELAGLRRAYDEACSERAELRATVEQLAQRVREATQAKKEGVQR